MKSSDVSPKTLTSLPRLFLTFSGFLRRRRSQAQADSSSSHDVDKAASLTRADLLELYTIAIDEYRFQVNLNWSRTQYYLALNVGILGVATGILELADAGVGILVAGLYSAGAVCCGLSLAAGRVQQGYYRTARDHKAVIEEELELTKLRLSTTPGMGSTMRRLGKVTTFNNVLLGILGVLDVAGAVIVTARM